MTPRNQGLLGACLLLVAISAWVIHPPQGRGPSSVSTGTIPVQTGTADDSPTTPGGSAADGHAAGGKHPSLHSVEPPSHVGADTHLAAQQAEPPPLAVPLRNDFLQRILASDQSTVTVPLPGGGSVQGRVSLLQRDGNGLLLVQGVVTHPEAGRFMFQRQTAAGKAGSLAGFIHYDTSAIAYQVRPLGENAQPVLVKTTADKVICRAYAIAPDAAEDPQEIPPTHPTDYPIPPDENGIIQLQSLPGATAVIYLDFDGEERDFAGWGYINAKSSVTAQVMPANNNRIYEIWKGVCEDFQPFNINITTTRGVFDAAPTGRRMQVVITPTSTASPGAGGVAYTQSFNWTTDTVCWAFWATYSTGKNMVEIISHEVGHTLGLSHDGCASSAQAYYSGHNGWAPIMGVGYYQTLSQWSKGEYPNATNPEDDLHIIASENNDVAYRADDHGATFATATWLDLAATGEVSNEGIIETTADEDAFRFATSGGTCTLIINNVSFNPNLDLKAELLDSSGVVIASHDPADSTDASISGLNLPAGEYFLRISGTGNGDLTTGYSDYASLGAYTITGNVSGGVPADRFTLAENSTAGVAVGTVSSRTSHGAGVLAFAINSGNTGGTFAIDPATGAITVASNELLDFEALSTRWDDPATFELFVSITDSLGTAEESIRTVVTVSDVNEPPVFPPLSALTIADHLVSGTLITTVEATDPDRFDYVTYSITGGNTGNAFGIDSTTGALSVNGALDFATTPAYTLTLRATDHLSPAQSVDVTLTLNLLEIFPNHSLGTIIRTFFNGIEGSTVASLTDNPNFPGRPHSEAVLTSFDSGAAMGESYGSTVRGYVIAPTTGNYTFWISSSDDGELWISPDTDPSKAVMRASVSNGFAWPNPNEWDKYPSQQSSEIALTAGQAYYIEARHKASIGGDHVQVAWKGPGMDAKEIIPGRWLMPYEQNYAPWADTQTLFVREAATSGQSIGGPAFIEPNLGQAVSSYAITAGNTAGIFSIDPLSGNITVTDGGGLTAGTAHVLTVSATDNGSPAMTGATTVTIRILGLHEQLHTWWKLDESSGVTVTDSSGNTRDATLSGGGSWLTRGAANQALQLNGSDAHIDYLGNSALSGGTSFTVAAWVKVPASHATDGMLIQQRNAGTNGYIGQYRVVVKADGKINFNVNGKDANNANLGSQFYLTSTNAINDGTWHHVACVRDGSNGRVYIDGVLRASGSGVLRMLDPTFTVAVGYDAMNNNAFLNATVDDVRIYAEALGSQQLVKIAGTPKVAITSPVTAAVDIPAGVGLMLQAAASDPDGAVPALAWSQLSGPGSVTFGTPSAAGSSALFSMSGSYILRVAASDGANTATAEVTVIVGGSERSPFGGFTYGGGAPGSHYPTGSNSYNLAGASSGIHENGTADGFYLLGKAFAGDFDLRARVTGMGDWINTNAGNAGLIVRYGTAGAADEASGFIGYDASGVCSLMSRASSGAGTTKTEHPSTVLPRWCRLTRNGDTLEFWCSGNGVEWTSCGTMTCSGVVRAGMCWSSNDLIDSGSASFDNVSGFSTSGSGPFVHAGADFTAVAGIPANLPGTVTDDGLPNPPAATSVSWSVVSGPGSVTFGNPNQAATTATCGAAGTYVLRLMAEDGASKTFDDTNLTAILVNTITVAATDEAAAETGPGTGTFTFTRGGSLIGDLTVDFTLGGAAANGVDYAALPAGIVMPAGVTSHTLTVTPVADALVEGPESVSLTILPGDYEITGSSAIVVIADSNHAPLWAAATLNGAAAEETTAYSGPSLATQATDLDGDALTFQKTSGPAWLVVAADGSLSGTPATVNVGPNVFALRVMDSGGLFADAVLNIFVRFTNHPPEAIGVPVIAANAAALVPYSGQSLASAISDPNLAQGDVLVFTKLGGPEWLEIAPDGQLSGTAQPGNLGTNIFSARVADSAGATTDIVLQITVMPPSLYLDTNGTTAGSGAPVSATWDSAAIWSAEPAGITTTHSWIDGAHAVLSAGEDAAASLITVSGSREVGSLTVEEGTPLLTGGTLVLAGATTDFTITGAAEVASELTGTGRGLVKSGAGTLDLSGSNSYTGATAVATGNLRISGALTASSSVLVAADGTLSGQGAITNGVTVSGTLAPGGGVGTLTTGPLALASGARIEWQASDWTGAAGSGYDQLAAASLDLSAASAVTVMLRAEALANFSESPATFTLVHTSSGCSGFDAAKFTLDTAAFSLATGTWAVQQNGNDLLLSYTPRTPFEAWQLAEFGAQAGNPLLAGDMADPDGDGLPNLLEFALDTHPQEAAATTIVHDLENVDGTSYLRLTISRNPAATDLNFSVQTTSDPSDPDTWTDADTVIEDETPKLVVRDKLAGPRRFIRLRVTR